MCIYFFVQQNVFTVFIILLDNLKNVKCGVFNCGEFDGVGVDDDNSVNFEGNFNNMANQKPQTGLV